MLFLHTAGWMACVVYCTIPSFWLVVHPYAEYWRARRRSPYRVLLPVWLGMWILVGTVTWPWRRFEIYSTPVAWAPAIVLFLIGVLLYVGGAKHFTKSQLGGRPEVENARTEQRLVTGGLRSRIRHPIYLGHFFEMLGWSIGTGLPVLFLLTAFAVVTGAIMLRQEDRELEQRFGDAYREYQRSVPAVIPQFFANRSD